MILTYFLIHKIGPNKRSNLTQTNCITELEIILAFRNYFSYYFWSYKTKDMQLNILGYL